MLYDISPPITSELKVWPGDTPPAREVLLDMRRGDHLTLSTLRATVHLGAHADAPSHYGVDAPTIEQRPLDMYIGPCAVVRVDTAPGSRVTPEMFGQALRRSGGSQVGTRNSELRFPDAEQAGRGAAGESAAASEPGVANLPPRVLIATGTCPDPARFNEDFAALSPELVDHLHDLGVRLVGIDTPSVDLFDSKDLPAHRRFLAHDMAILEGLVLRDVPEGLYELIALPLPLAGFDASPVRAVLRSL